MLKWEILYKKFCKTKSTQWSIAQNLFLVSFTYSHHFLFEVQKYICMIFIHVGFINYFMITFVWKNNHHKSLWMKNVCQKFCQKENTKQFL